MRVKRIKSDSIYCTRIDYITKNQELHWRIYQVYDTYELEQEKGICLELEVMMSGMIATTH